MANIYKEKPTYSKYIWDNRDFYVSVVEEHVLKDCTIAKLSKLMDTKPYKVYSWIKKGKKLLGYTEASWLLEHDRNFVCLSEDEARTLVSRGEYGKLSGISDELVERYTRAFGTKYTIMSERGRLKRKEIELMSIKSIFKSVQYLRKKGFKVEYAPNE